MTKEQIFVFQLARGIYVTKNIEWITILSKGITNSHYLLRINNELKVIRIPTQISPMCVNYRYERETILCLERNIPTVKLEYYDCLSGVKSSSYLEGITLYEARNKNYHQVANILNTFHNTNFEEAVTFLPVPNLEKWYLKVRTNLSSELQKMIDIMIDKIKWLIKPYENSEKVFCHMDATPKNYLIDLNGQVHLVDFENAKLFDCYYDLALFGFYDFKESLILFEHYFNHQPTAKDFNHLYTWYLYQHLEHNLLEFVYLDTMNIDSTNPNYQKIVQKLNVINQKFSQNLDI